MASVLISGANRGLGRSLADKFVAEGWQVFAGHRGLAGQSVAPRESSAQLTWVGLDVQDSSSIAAAARTVSERTQGLDVLINNAAVNLAEDNVPLGQLDFDALALVYDVNAVGPLRVIQGFLALLQRGERKLIINVSSEAGSIQQSCRDRQYGYCMSKAAMNMQTTMLNRGLAAKGFNAISIHPGWVRTDMGGPRAALDPMESARAMYEVISKANAQTPRFLQHDGKELPW